GRRVRRARIRAAGTACAAACEGAAAAAAALRRRRAWTRLAVDQRSRRFCLQYAGPERAGAERPHARGPGQGNAAADAQDLARRQSAEHGRAPGAGRDRAGLTRKRLTFGRECGLRMRAGVAKRVTRDFLAFVKTTRPPTAARPLFR